MSDEENEASDGSDAEEEEAPATDDEQEATDAAEAEETTDIETAVTEETLDEQLNTAQENLEGAETESDLDEIEAALEEIESDLEAADLEEPEDEDEPGPREELEERIAGIRDQLEEKRGPYAEDVLTAIEESKTTIQETEWTERGEADLVEVVERFLESVDEILGATLSISGTDLDALAAGLEDAEAAVADADLDPDDDAETIELLLEATDELAAGIDEAEEWDDLTVREKLDAHGFYDVLSHVKDYPPETGAIKEWEKRARPDMILLALDLLGSEFTEEECLRALARLGDEESLEPMLERAKKRRKLPITVLGKIGSEEALETILDYVDADKDPNLQKITLRAVGEIGSEEATQAVANKLVAENETIRSHAARTLGLIGDTRAIQPLADVLANDESHIVRGSAAWALNQIGTEKALAELADYADDRVYLVQTEAQKAV